MRKDTPRKLEDEMELAVHNTEEEHSRQRLTGLREGRLRPQGASGQGKKLGAIHVQGPLIIWIFTLFWQVFCCIVPTGLLPYFQAEYESFKIRVMLCSQFCLWR